MCTDGSKRGVGGYIYQKVDGEERINSYFSRQTTKDEQKWDTRELELLAVLSTLEAHHHLLDGQQVVCSGRAVTQAQHKPNTGPTQAQHRPKTGRCHPKTGRCSLTLPAAREVHGEVGACGSEFTGAVRLPLAHSLVGFSILKSARSHYPLDEG